MRRCAVMWVVAIALAASGCATGYTSRTSSIRAAYRAYDEERALQLLEAQEKSGPQIDSLLVLLDKGTILHAQGKWKESIEVLARADDLASQVDTTSVTEEVGTVLANESTRMYRGEDFEKLMISVLQALNYTELGDEDGALVEVRRCNERLEKMVSKEKKKYEQLPIARYLGGLLYENARNFDAAAIDYLKAAELAPYSPAIVAAALRLSKKTSRDDAYRDLLAQHPNVEHEPISLSDGQVVVLLELGQAPEKQTTQRRNIGSQLIVVPQYPAQRVRLAPQQVTIGGAVVKSHLVTSINDVAHHFLEERIGGLIAKSALSLGLKAGAGALVGGLTQSSELGALTFALLTLSQGADTRSWLSLPSEFQVSSGTVKPGTVEVTVNALGRTSTHSVEVKAGKATLLIVRRY